MGIDIYARWNGMTDEEGKKQCTGFRTLGSAGYLREAYHGEPYATQYLLSDAFDSDECEAQIPASVLRERLPHTLELVENRLRSLYQATDEEIDQMKQEYIDYVELCERKEAELGEPVTVVASY